jgi:ribosomal protein L29
MKSRDKKELFTKSEKELRKALKEAKEALFNLNLDNKQNKLKNTRQLFWKKKEIALIFTALREKEILNAKNV